MACYWARRVQTTKEGCIFNQGRARKFYIILRKNTAKWVFNTDKKRTLELSGSGRGSVMIINQGSKVVFIDRFGETNKGKVTRIICDIKGKPISYYVKLEDGFIVPCRQKDLTLVDEDKANNSISYT